MIQITYKLELSDEHGRICARCSVRMFCHETFALRKESLRRGGCWVDRRGMCSETDKMELRVTDAVDDTSEWP